MIAQYVGRNHRRWDEKLAALAYAYNSASHDATGFTPAYLNCGRELSPPHQDDRARPREPITQATWRRHLEEALKLARINLAHAFQRQTPYYNLRCRNWKPKVGNTVWRKDHPLSKKATGHNAKLAPKYSGPYQVGRVITPVIVDLRDTKGKWYQHIHVQDLKPTTGEDGPTALTEPPKK
jgi:hypothetical protein